MSRRERRHELDGYRVRVRVRLRLTLAVTLLTYAPGRARRARERSPPRAPAGAPRGAAAERARRRVRRRPDRVALARRAATAAHLPRAAPDSRRPQLAHRGSMSLARPRCCRREGSVHGTVYSRHRSVELLYTTSVWAESRAEYLDECTSLTRYVGLPQSRMHPLHGHMLLCSVMQTSRGPPPPLPPPSPPTSPPPSPPPPPPSLPPTSRCSNAALVELVVSL